MSDPYVVGSVVTAAGSVTVAALSSAFYLWRRDPAQGRNAVLADLTAAIAKLHEHLLAAQQRSGERDRENRAEHQQIVVQMGEVSKSLGDLTNLIAPRRIASG